MGYQQSKTFAFCACQIRYMEQLNNRTKVDYGYRSDDVYFERELFDKIKNGYCTRCGHVDKCVSFPNEEQISAILRSYKKV